MPHVSPHRRGRFVERTATRDHLDKQAALHRSEERRAGEREVSLEVGDAVIEIPRRPAKRRLHLERASPGPLADPFGGGRTTDAERDLSIDTLFAGPDIDRRDSQSRRGEIVGDRCVLDHDSTDA